MGKQPRKYRALELRRQGLTYAAIAEIIKQEYGLARLEPHTVCRDIQTATRIENEVIYQRGPLSKAFIIEQLQTTYAPA